MKNEKLTTVFFDLDGTLVDTAPDLAFALNSLVAEEGLDPLPYEQIRSVASNGSPGLLNLAFKMDKNHADYQRLRTKLLEIYYDHICIESKLFSGMNNVLENLEEYGIPWGVVTNKPTYLSTKLLQELNLNHRCTCIIGGDSTARCKPYPDSLYLACKTANVIPKECVYIGDAERDIQAAKQAGMRSIAALYGYLMLDDQPQTWDADHYVKQPIDILTWVEKQLSS